MDRHPHFPELLLHTDDQLAAVLGAELVDRRTIHEWPLSCVQRVTLADGRTLAYKSQLPPTVEPEFYRRVSAAFLPGCLALEPVADCAFLLIDWIDAPSLRDVADGPADLLAHGREITAAIGAVTPAAPHYLDLGTEPSWRRETGATFAKAATLVRDGRFRSIDLADLRQLAAWAGDPVVIGRVIDGARLVNGDLRCDQVLITTSGYCVLDWQRPVIALPQVDLVSLLLGEDLEPRDYVDPMVDRVYWMMRLQWAVECQHDLFPDSHGAYDDAVGFAVARILD